MKFHIAADVAAVIAASPAAAGNTFATVDGPGVPGGPAVLGTVVTAINDGGLATGYYVTGDGFGGPGNYTGFTGNRDGSGFTSFARPGFVRDQRSPRHHWLLCRSDWNSWVRRRLDSQAGDMEPDDRRLRPDRQRASP